MNKLLMLLVVSCLLSAAPCLAKSRGGVVTVEVDLSAQEPGKEARLWLPYAVSDAEQQISHVKISGDYASSAVYTERVNGTPILYAQWDKNTAGRKLVYSFTVEREEAVRRSFPAKESSWSPDDYRQYLAATSLGPVDGEVKKIAEMITKGKTTVLEKAKAIYDWTCENTWRDPDTRGCGKGDVCALLKKPGGKCTDISSVFVALARAAGVPAREIFGIRLGKKAEEDITGWQHCWAEFYLPGYGWVPVDPADVRKAMLVEKLKPEDVRTRELHDYFWGGIDQYRVKLAFGRDLVLNPAQSGAPLNTFGYPYAEVGGNVIDWLEPATFSYRITYREK
ncbi:transglutaminase-like cysteine protease [Geotalea daltonii FRC-32]|uniref:Transglutaminase-like cysteine protease n=1 Tax=Geotalea daltonii (strain DSM 22248 / JCM 15807 / FRC-32) TaxID=316067 RepID=B9M4V7_GEODF|nr:transglutaminase domain-containing protein [Geotalea daltonii]ACM21641.1 transglutaminase-like cysteine protease [Geotalea daltonii FRC-32]